MLEIQSRMCKALLGGVDTGGRIGCLLASSMSAWILSAKYWEMLQSRNAVSKTQLVHCWWVKILPGLLQVLLFCLHVAKIIIWMNLKDVGRILKALLRWV